MEAKSPEMPTPCGSPICSQNDSYANDLPGGRLSVAKTIHTQTTSLEIAYL
jgi:hypothetical protein